MKREVHTFKMGEWETVTLEMTPREFKAVMCGDGEVMLRVLWRERKAKRAKFGIVKAA